eukprot:m.289200 g.289200  ORF g.289200 m.289200 type:complete len:215 (+) comp27102_c1_seq10:1285-1929(+)
MYCTVVGMLQFEMQSIKVGAAGIQPREDGTSISDIASRIRAQNEAQGADRGRRTLSSCSSCVPSENATDPICLDIQFVFLNSTNGTEFPESEQQYFEDAKCLWESMVPQYLPISNPSTFDGVINITAQIEPIDGVSNVIGFGGPTQITGVGSFTYPVAGEMVFDSEDVDSLVAAERFGENLGDSRKICVYEFSFFCLTCVECSLYWVLDLLRIT